MHRIADRYAAPLEPSRERMLGRVALVAGLYWATATLGVELAVEDELTPIWIPSSIALVAALLWGRWMVAGVVIGELVAAIGGGLEPIPAIGLAIGNGLEVLVALLVLGGLGFDRELRRVRDGIALFAAALVGAATSATVGIATFLAAGIVGSEDIPNQWLRFFASVALSILLFAPFLLAWLAPVRRATRAHLLLEATTLAIVGVLVTIAAFTIGGEASTFLVYPVFMLAALRFGVRGATTSVVGITVIVLGIDQLRSISIAGLDQIEVIQLLQAFLAAVGLANLLLATMLEERDTAMRQVEHTASSLELAQGIAHLGSWELQLDPGAPPRMTWSPELCRLFGLGPDREPTLDALASRIHPEDREAFTVAVENTLTSGLPFTLQHRVEQTSFTEHVVSHSGVLVEAEPGHGPRLVSTAIDVTERSAIDRLRDELIATASHELRTPITSIVGFTDTLLERWEQFTASQRFEFLGIIHAEGNRLTRIVDDTFVQSTIDSGALKLHLQPVVVEDVVREELERSPLAERAVFDSAVGLIARGSGEHLARIVRNLLDNAASYGRAPYRVVTRPSADDAYVEVHVIDHGDGIDADYRPELFKRFTRGPGTERRPGSGLGLSIVRGLALAMGGRVQYVRTDEDATDFVVHLPVWKR